MGDAHAEHAPEGLVHPAVAWGTLGAHVVNAKGARGALEWGVVSVRNFLATSNKPPPTKRALSTIVAVSMAKRL